MSWQSAASFLRTINIDVAFLSSSSWDTERGMSTPSEGKASVKEAVLTVSRRRVLVCDSSKFNKYGMFHICGLEQLTDIISDNRLPENAQQTIASRGVKLHLVDGREVHAMLKLAANLDWLFTDLPIEGRFQAAKAAGFAAQKGCFSGSTRWEHLRAAQRETSLPVVLMNARLATGHRVNGDSLHCPVEDRNFITA